MKQILIFPRNKITVISLFITLMFLLSACQGGVSENDPNLISELGRYKGYSKPVYEEWVRTSQYVEVRDGTKLAIDVIRPAVNGEPVDDPLPVIWTHHRYHRAVLRDSTILSMVDMNPWLKTILRHGYVVASLDVRGGGASFGNQPYPFSTQETQDAYDVTEWLAEQPWCDTNVGMYGASYLGITQYFTASAAPPHLKAIIPAVAMFDFYSFVVPGGVYRNDFITNWNQLTINLDTTIPPVAVDSDTSGEMLRNAKKEHTSSRNVEETFRPLIYRNSIDPESKKKLHQTQSPNKYLTDIKKSKVAVYHWGGWFDIYTRDEFMWYSNLDNPQRITIGPWTHMQVYTGFIAEESLRWYDYWLKGIDNGIMDENPIHYYTMGAPEGKEWRSASQWPLPDETPIRFYFNSGTSHSLNSFNDGVLNSEQPSEKSASDIYTVDYTASSGKPSRWSNGYGNGGPEFSYPDMTPNDEKGLTYTTMPLDADIEVTGHPIVNLWVTSTAKDGDFFVYLEEVDTAGISHYITEGTLRASHRALSQPQFEYLGLPWHRSNEQDVADLPDEPVELVFDMLPTSNIFDAGHRIRITITCADKDNCLTPELSPAPQVTVYRNSEYPSHVVMPVIP